MSNLIAAPAVFLAISIYSWRGSPTVTTFYGISGVGRINKINFLWLRYCVGFSYKNICIFKNNNPGLKPCTCRCVALHSPLCLLLSNTVNMIMKSNGMWKQRLLSIHFWIGSTGNKSPFIIGLPKMHMCESAQRGKTSIKSIFQSCVVILLVIWQALCVKFKFQLLEVMLNSFAPNYSRCNPPAKLFTPPTL